MDKYQVKILDIKNEYDNVFTYSLEMPEGLKWDEGSSFHLALNDYDKGGVVNKKLVHHLSINTLTDEDCIRFTTKIPIRKSVFKKALSKLEVGDYVTIYEFDSNMSLIREDKPIVLLSQGLAMSTIRPLIKKYEQNSSNIPELTSININANDIHLYESDFQDIDSHILEKYWLNNRSDYIETIKELARDKKDAYFYIVGSEHFVLDTLYILRENGIGLDKLIIDKDSNKRNIVFKTLENYKIIL